MRTVLQPALLLVTLVLRVCFRRSCCSVEAPSSTYPSLKPHHQHTPLRPAKLLPLRRPTAQCEEAGGEEGGEDVGTKGLRLCLHGRMRRYHSRLLATKQKGSLTLPCVGVFSRPASYQVNFRLLPPLARTFTVDTDGSIGHAWARNRDSMPATARSSSTSPSAKRLPLPLPMDAVPSRWAS